jgi:hypothetical protein
VPIWEWCEAFQSNRTMRVEAETEEEARAKMKSGEWLDEHEFDFFALTLLKDLARVEDD